MTGPGTGPLIPYEVNRHPALDLVHRAGPTGDALQAHGREIEVRMASGSTAVFDATHVPDMRAKLVEVASVLAAQDAIAAGFVR